MFGTFPKKVSFPVFVKPNDSRGSRGQSICYSYDELEEAIKIAKNESSSDEIVIEKYMKGKQDFSMTYFVINRIPYLIRVCDRYLGKEEDNLNKQCIGCVSPSKFTSFYLNNVDIKIKSFIKKLGIINGPVFMQGFIDDDTIRFYDPGLRFPGGDYELFLQSATGINLMELLIEFAITGKITHTIADDLFLLNGKHAIQLDFTCRSGKISKFVGIEEIRENKNVISSFERYQIGETIPDSGDVRQRVFEVALLVDDKASVSKSVKEIQSLFDVLDENGNSMLISQLDIKMLNYNYKI